MKTNARSIAISGNDAYTSGYDNNGLKGMAMYCKNGIATALTDGTNDAFTNATAILNNNV